MTTTKQRNPDTIATQLQHEVKNAINRLSDNMQIDDWLKIASEDVIIVEMQESLAIYLEGQLQPILDEYRHYQQQVSDDEKDTVEQAYRQANGM